MLVTLLLKMETLGKNQFNVKKEGLIGEGQITDEHVKN
jgi:hypothetical protein